MARVIIPFAGHFSKEELKILSQLFWTRIYKEIADFCASCPECQCVTPNGVAKTPLVPFLLVDNLFEKIGVDSAGLLEKYAVGYLYIMVIVDCDFLTMVFSTWTTLA